MTSLYKIVQGCIRASNLDSTPVNLERFKNKETTGCSQTVSLPFPRAGCLWGYLSLVDFTMWSIKSVSVLPARLDPFPK